VRADLDANRHELAKQHLEGARAALARLERVPIVTEVDCLRAEADLADNARDFLTAEAKLRKAQQLLEQSENTRGLLYHAVLTDLGGIYFRTSRFRESLELNERTARALDENGRGGTIGRVRVAMNRASVLLRLGEVQRAEEASRDAMRRAQRLDEDKPTQPDQVVAYGTILNRLGRNEEAIARLTAASRELHASRSGARALQADYQLARALMLVGRYDESQKLLDEVHAAWSANPTANKDRLGDLARTRAEIELARRRVNEASELIDAALVQFGYPAKSDGLGPTAALTAASRIYLARNQLPRAESLARDALRISEGIARDPAQSADVGEAALVLAALQRAKGDRAAARSSVDRAVVALTNSLGGDHLVTREAQALQTALHE